MDLEKNNRLYGVYLEKKLIVFLSWFIRKEAQMTLKNVETISPERGNQYGKFILDHAPEIARNEQIEQLLVS